jgi:dTDP-4-dehydrorhamnose reductase
MKVAVFGAGGQLGRELTPRLPGEVVALTREKADLTRPAELRTALEALRPDVVVNCAAYNLVDRAESEPAATFAVNAFGVRDLALACRDLDCTLVHFSTDYVFGLDETRTTPWQETDAPGPVSAYGVSKLAGEYFVRAVCPRHLVIRTCGLYGLGGAGGKGGNFVETMLGRAADGRPLRVVADQICTPTYTGDLAVAVVGLLQGGAGGLCHVTNTGACTWHEFAATVFDLAAVRADLAAITSREYAAPARRPTYSVLSTAAYQARGFPPPRPWREALAAYLEARNRKDRT